MKAMKTIEKAKGNDGYRKRETCVRDRKVRKRQKRTKRLKR